MDIIDTDTKEWRIARERVADVRGLIADGSPSGAQVADLAQQWGVSRATVWRRVGRFRQEGSIRAFLNSPRGVRPGTKALEAAVERIVHEVARSWWQQSENATIAEIFPSIACECSARSLPAPSRATVARRLAVLRADPANFSGEVRRALRERTRLLKGHYNVTEPLRVVQIDHTVADVFVVDPVSRQCIGRPTLTLAIDVATRCVLGMCLSLEAPSALLVALCLEHAVFPKEGWLRELGLEIEWPMHGRMLAVHCDNGREFHSAGFRRGCDLNGIETIYRPPGTPRFGGHIERLIGTLMRRVRLLPGSSYSDLLRARPSRAEQRAALSLRDLGGFLVEDIARYHARAHRALGRAPRSAWEALWRGKNSPPLLNDRQRFRYEFLPARRRVVGREGIELFRLKYSSEALASYVAPGLPRVVRFDPRDLSQVYLEREDGAPLSIPLRDRALPAMSLWEWIALKHQEGPLAQQPLAELLHARLQLPHTEDSPLATPAPSLRATRLAARRAAWREVQALAALPAPAVGMHPTITSTDLGGSFEWEVLE